LPIHVRTCRIALPDQHCRGRKERIVGRVEGTGQAASPARTTRDAEDALGADGEVRHVLRVLIVRRGGVVQESCGKRMGVAESAAGRWRVVDGERARVAKMQS
jgi:predicted DNA-binding protein (UPF0251 family)